MEFAQLGSLNIRVSRVALGTWAIGGWLWGGTDVEDSIRTIHEALDIGITTIDTAPVYGFGLAEEILAEALARRSIPQNRVIIATKAGMEWDEQENVRRNSKPERVRQEIEDSLRRLKTDYIDLYQIHWPDPDTPIEDTAAVLKELYEEGKIRAIGVSNFTVEQMERWREVAPLHSCQPRYNMLERQIEGDVLPYCRDHNIAVLAYSPLARGLLTGKYGMDAQFPPGDSRARDSRFQPDALRRHLKVVEGLRALADELGRTVSQFAFRWVLDQPGVTVGLWGARRPDQIREAAGVLGWHLSAEQLARIDALLQAAQKG